MVVLPTTRLVTRSRVPALLPYVTAALYVYWRTDGTATVDRALYVTLGALFITAGALMAYVAILHVTGWLAGQRPSALESRLPSTEAAAVSTVVVLALMLGSHWADNRVTRVAECLQDRSVSALANGRLDLSTAHIQWCSREYGVDGESGDDF